MFRFIFKMFMTSLVFAAIFYTTLYFIPQEYYKKAISWVIKQQTGATLNIKGDIGFSPFDNKMISFADVDFSHSESNGAHAALNFEELALYKEDFDIKNIKIKNTQILFKDKSAGSEYKIFDFNSNIVVPTRSRPMSMTGDLVVRGEKVNYDIIIEDPEAMKDGGTSAVTADISSSFLKLDYDGVHGKNSKKGKLEVDISSIANVLLWSGAEKKIEGNGVATLDYNMDSKDVSSFNGTSKIAFKNLVQNYTDEGMNKLISQLTGSSMKIDDLTGSFNIKDGIVYSKDLLGIGTTSFKGKGSVNLVDRTIDYRIIPDVKLSKVRGLKLTPPVSIKGSLMNPQITVEVQDVVKEIIQKPEQLIQTIKDVTSNNAEGKQVKEDLQGLRDQILKDPDMQKQLLDGFLGGLGQSQPQ